MPAWPSLGLLHEMTSADMAAIKDYVDGVVYFAVQATAIALGTTDTAITFATGSEQIDTAGGHDESTNPARYTVQSGEDGLYICMGTLAGDSAAGSGFMTGFWRRNTGGGVNQQGRAAANVVSGDATWLPLGVAVFPCVAGDYIQMFGKRSGGTAYNTKVISGEASSVLIVKWSD
jgi:hypothetical protein